MDPHLRYIFGLCCANLHHTVSKNHQPVRTRHQLYEQFLPQHQRNFCENLKNGIIYYRRVLLLARDGICRRHVLRCQQPSLLPLHLPLLGPLTQTLQQGHEHVAAVVHVAEDEDQEARHDGKDQQPDPDGHQATLQLPPLGCCWTGGAQREGVWVFVCEGPPCGSLDRPPARDTGKRQKMTRRQLAIIDLSICVVAHFNHMDPSDRILAML